MESIRIVINGQPQAKGRPRFARLPNGGVRTFTPEGTRKWESYARQLAQEAMGGRPLIASAVSVQIIAVVSIPQSIPKFKREMALRGQWYPIKRPDVDQFVKCALDALNGVVLTDDSVVVSLDATKIYGDPPRVEITVTPMGLVETMNKATGELFAQGSEGEG